MSEAPKDRKSINLQALASAGKGAKLTSAGHSPQEKKKQNEKAQVHFYVTPEQKKAIEQKAAEHKGGVTMTNYIIDLLYKDGAFAFLK